MAGLFLLHRGRTAEALQIANFAVLLWEASKPKGVFNMLYDAGAGEVVDDDAARPKPHRAWLQNKGVMYRIDPNRERQHFYAAGLTVALLSEVYAATGVTRYLDAAYELMEFDTKCSWAGAAKRWPSKCKAAWGAANLLRYALLPQPDRPKPPLSATEVAGHAMRVCQHCFLENQHPDGHFGNFHFPIHDSCVENLGRAGGRFGLLGGPARIGGAEESGRRALFAGRALSTGAPSWPRRAASSPSTTLWARRRSWPRSTTAVTLTFNHICNHICSHICNHICNHMCNHICNHNTATSSQHGPSLGARASPALSTLPEGDGSMIDGV